MTRLSFVNKMVAVVLLVSGFAGTAQAGGLSPYINANGVTGINYAGSVDHNFHTGRLAKGSEVQSLSAGGAMSTGEFVVQRNRSGRFGDASQRPVIGQLAG